MRQLIIKNFGPIINASIDLNKINVIIGKQSSGKSCVMKIACYCSWVEKRIEIEQNPNRFINGNYFINTLVDFHKLNGFVNEKSHIKYSSPLMEFEYCYGENLLFKWKAWDKFKRNKIVYVPSERNIVAAIPNWYSVKMKDNNILNFMSDWETARKNSGKLSLKILNLNASYSYDKDRNLDLVKMDNTKNLEFTNVSSGLQSIIPLYVVVNYLSHNIYSVFNEQSVASKEEIKNITRFILDNFANKSENEIIKKYDNFIKVHSTDVYLEEPECNLYPTTQRDLIYWLVENVTGRRNNSLFVTTHSPYIMIAINNMIQAGNIVAGNKLLRAKVENIIGKRHIIDYDDVSAYYVQNGELLSIKDDESRLVVGAQLDEVSSEISVEFDKLLNI